MAGFFLIMIVIALFEIPVVIRRKQWRELIAFGVLWIIAATYGALVLADVPVPRPGELIITFFEEVSKMLSL